MKTNPAALLLGIGVAAVIVGVVVAHETKASPTSPTPPSPSSKAPPIDPTIGSYTIADADALANLNQATNQALTTLGVPPHAFVTTKSLGPLLAATPNAQGIALGTVSAWIAQQNVAGHRVFMSPPLTAPSAPGEVGWAFVLDTAPAGYTEVTS